MFLNILRSKSTWALAAAVVTGVASSANAAILFTGGSATIVSDTGDRHTVATTSPIPVDYDVALSNLYGTPTVTTPSGVITKFNFQNLSSQFRSTASTAMYNATESVDIDGKLVLTLHFDTAVQLSASIYEDGLVNTTNNGSFQILGGGVAIEAVDASPLETHSAAFASTTSTTTTGNTTSGGWVATANIGNFTGLYTDYQITIDNNLLALATANGNVTSTADIYKKDFILTIGTNGGSGRTPEPASVGVLALGATAMLARRRR